MKRWLLVLLWLPLPLVATADAVRVVDDADREVVLERPAERIVSLAPNITENLFSAGAGKRIVATVEYSDYPEEAKEIPRIGRYDRLDLEGIIAAEPDLVVGWISGNLREPIERLHELGVPVYLIEPRRPGDVAHTVRQLGRLAGTSAVAEAVATDFLARFETLRGLHAERAPVGVFYQIWDDPLMTINDAHLISALIRGCGGRNAFGELESLAPRIDREAVLARDPEVIVASSVGGERPEWLDDWRDWPELRAVARENLYFVPSDKVQRHTVRTLEGMERLCGQLEEARERRRAQ